MKNGFPHSFGEKYTHISRLSLGAYASTVFGLSACSTHTMEHCDWLQDKEDIIRESFSPFPKSEN